MDAGPYPLASGNHVRISAGQIEVVSGGVETLRTIPVSSVVGITRDDAHARLRLRPAETVTLDFDTPETAASFEALLTPQVAKPKSRAGLIAVWCIGGFFALLVIGAIGTALGSLGTPRATTVATLPKTPTTALTEAQAKALYRSDVDVRDLVKDVNRYKNLPLVYDGTVLTVFVDDSQKATQLQVEVTPPSATAGSEPIIVVFASTTAADGIYKGDHVRVWLRPMKMQSFKNGFGADVSQPLCAGDYIEKH